MVWCGVGGVCVAGVCNGLSFLSLSSSLLSSECLKHIFRQTLLTSRYEPKWKHDEDGINSLLQWLVMKIHRRYSNSSHIIISAILLLSLVSCQNPPTIIEFLLLNLFGKIWASDTSKCKFQIEHYQTNHFNNTTNCENTPIMRATI